MYPIWFHKERAEQILSAIKSGQSIPGPTSSAINPLGGWNIYEMLQVAGAMYFCLWSHGPATSDLERFNKLPAEHREASEETLSEDVHDAIEFYNQLTMMVEDDEYDQQLKPVVQGVVYREDGGKNVVIVKGGKKS